MEYLVIGAGGFLGANTRYLVASLIAQRLGVLFPYGTLLINLTGSFVIGFFLAFTSERVSAPPEYRLFFVTGFLGAYTTFSTFSYDSLLMMQQGDWGALALYVGGSVVLGLGAAALGVVAARLL
ncbi:MAG: fluoride efflux transporter CrcB [Chloroflexi bacterium]|nr:fluoride efflux transporter CrcB [Chloroflexota bacterium]